ncbi:hypothetical protein M3172_16330 [Mesobacillus subterraneus]|uniref:hypothetical protein n=1 Tax=Mesobacillus subterraneus TaxID=285983 RepID=UPI00203C444C|nr:hypothetical protein [Mesobacillus subterraneus]MCM3574766.1 hypothetical protein [Mesobacillus subterraneus]
MSEVEVSSDRFDDKRGKVVRSRGKFRQVWWQKEEKLSEVEVSSDRFGAKGGKVVRSRGKFRQV